MITIRYFASLRDKLNTETEEFEWQEHFVDVAKLKQHLATRNQQWATLKDDKNILVAVNQAMSNNKTPLNDGDEVAFFPPVTGG